MQAVRKLRRRSRNLLLLEQELALLRSHMLPAEPHPTGDYSDSDLSRTRAYRVLAHAEFEYYLEERARELCRWAIQKWKTKRRPTRTIASLLSFYGTSMGAPRTNTPADRAKWISEIDLVARLDEASRQFHFSISSNHGIREQNIVQMMVPVGIDVADLDSAWLSTIDSFGQSRGASAHQSGSVQRITTLLDPFTELQTVEQLLDGVKDLDEKLNVLKR